LARNCVTSARIDFVNVMTKYSETAGFKASDFLKNLERYIGRNIIDYVVVNKDKPNLMRLKSYVDQKSEFVEPDQNNLAGKPIPIIIDLLKTKGLIRHDPEKIAQAIKMIV